ncbi:MAG: cupin domain-containing protein [Bacteroidales bacterium]|jgi:mannose-6-phosphate isomerase-like protein (cupin superfamily)
MDSNEYYFEENCFISEILNTPLDPDVSVARVRVLPGESTRWHLLVGISERYLILEGSGLVQVGEGEPRGVIANDTVVIPQGVKQRITNSGNCDLIFLAVCTPRFVRDQYLTL